MITEPDATLPTDHPISADDLAEIIGAESDLELEVSMKVVSIDAFGNFAPYEGDAPLRRPFASEMLRGLRAMTMEASNYLALADSAFSRAEQLTYADYGGTEQIDQLEAAVRTLAATRERDEPIRVNASFAANIVGVILHQWSRLGGTPNVDLFAAWARLALKGRRQVPEPLLTATILQLTAAWRVPQGGSSRRPFRHSSDEWEFVQGMVYYGSLDGEETRLFPEQAIERATTWADVGALHYVLYRDTSQNNQLVLIASGSADLRSSEQAAFMQTGSGWEECAVPDDLLGLIAWTRLNSAEGTLVLTG